MFQTSITVFGRELSLYYLGYLLAFPICVLFNGLYYRKKYKLGNIKVVLYSMLGLNMTYLGLLVSVALLKNTFVHGMNWVRVVGFVPLLWLPLALISKVKASKLLDFLTPSLGLNNMIIHTFCVFGGCCYGYPIENYPSWMQWMGIYNNQAGMYLFPTQILESLTYGIIGLIVVLWARHKKFETQGLAFPIYAILFGIGRFLWELMRYNEKIVGPLSEFNFWCIAWIVEGVVWIAIVKAWLRAHPKEAPAIEPPDESLLVEAPVA